MKREKKKVKYHDFFVVLFRVLKKVDSILKKKKWFHTLISAPKGVHVQASFYIYMQGLKDFLSVI